jgi:hypothetical protein
VDLADTATECDHLKQRFARLVACEPCIIAAAREFLANAREDGWRAGLKEAADIADNWREGETALAAELRAIANEW